MRNFLFGIAILAIIGSPTIGSDGGLSYPKAEAQEA